MCRYNNLEIIIIYKHKFACSGARFLENIYVYYTRTARKHRVIINNCISQVNFAVSRRRRRRQTYICRPNLVQIVKWVSVRKGVWYDKSSSWGWRRFTASGNRLNIIIINRLRIRS